MHSNEEKNQITLSNAVEKMILVEIEFSCLLHD